MSAALAIPTQQAWNALIAADVLYVDETGWRECNKRSWLWAATCSDATAFRVAPTRGSVVLEACFGDALKTGIFVSDRCRSYRIIDIDRRAICHAHLKRDFVKMTEFGPQLGKEIGSAALVVHQRIFKLYRRFEAGEFTRERFIERMHRHERALRKLMERGSTARTASGKSAQNLHGMCRDILAHWSALWTFVNTPNVEATNNLAERSLRKAVLWRKGSFGTQSSAGSRFVERILTVTQTCVQQGRHAAHYIEEAVQAARLKREAPSMLAPA